MKMLRYILAAGLLTGIHAAAWGESARQTVNFNAGWTFFRPDANPHSTAQDMAETGFDDGAWEHVTIPHTVRLEPFDAAGGRNYQGVCWYRRHFAADPSWQGKKLLLRFDGAMQVADVWLNGTHLFTHYCGYLPFTIDVTDGVKFDGENVLAVRLDNSDNPEVPPGKPQDQLDFCYFGGLSRLVHLDVTDRLHVSDVYLANHPAGGGIFVTFPQASNDAATVHVQTEVINEYPDRRQAAVTQELVDAAGAVVATGSADLDLAGGESKTAVQELHVNQPRLWHPDHPYLYTLRTRIDAAGKTVDNFETRIGIRAFRMDAEKGLFINGEKFVSLGANRHQDHPYVGYALSPNAQYRDAWKLRMAGFTSIRSHYPQDPAFVDACDELGLLLIVSNPGWQTGGDALFEKRVYDDARQMVRRDRNHACVILWEAPLNETYGFDRKIFPELQKIVHEEFPFDGCYTAGDSVGGKGKPDWDVVYHDNKGDKPLWIREIGDVVDNWGDQQSPVRVARGWGEAAMLTQVWSHIGSISRGYQQNEPAGSIDPRVCGLDLWAGVDAYRGYHHQPFLGGPLDLFRIPKFDYYFFQSQRPADVHVDGLKDGPMVFIANYATFQSPSLVTIFSNCQEVRLSMVTQHNDKETESVIGTQKSLDGLALPHPPFRFKAGQYADEQSPLFMTGIAHSSPVTMLKAEGLIDGKVAATQIVAHPGVARQIRLDADLCNRDLAADGNDWIRVYAHVCDGHATTCPFANDEVTFSVDGPAQVIDDARIHANPIRAEAGIATILIRGTMQAGTITVHATAFGLKDGVAEVKSKGL